MVAFATILIGLVVLLTRRLIILFFTELSEIQNLFSIGMIFLIIETIPDSNQFVF